MMVDHKNWDEEELLASRRAMWGRFVTFSTVIIVLVALVLIGMALFLL